MNSCHTPAVVACRVLGLYLAVQSLAIFFNFFVTVTLPFGFYNIRHVEYRSMLVSAAISVAITVALMVAVWKLSPWIATKMLAGPKEERATPSPITLEDLQVVAISVLGLLFICEALPGLVAVPLEHLHFLWLEPNASAKSLVDAAMVRALAMGLTKVGLGAWLFLGARSFVRVFQRFCPRRAD
jgi:hypothetical protein